MSTTACVLELELASRDSGAVSALAGSASSEVLRLAAAWLFADETAPEPPHRELPLGAGAGQARRNVVALLVEDNRVDVLMIQEAIETYQLAIDLFVATDGEQAWEFLERAETDPDAPCPHLLILDLNLPRRSGIEVLQRVRSSLACGSIPVLIITSSDLSQEREELVRLHAEHYFRKPTGYEDYLRIGKELDEMVRTCRPG